ncbi:hypothetical protein NO2_0238 [Candidatus Termititenax persephonae]|uniref:Outer membrane protein beta-barrel domain-containing protein n=1 Tax=Candidatus Termititenax persephonae TaxID=2218525 RepID=A0A388TEV9_9BACT|nr:hypothetical protein NO2_0238 [Candidatus Termititenax persephonae]
MRRLKSVLFLSWISLSLVFGAEAGLRTEKLTIRGAWNFLGALNLRYVEHGYSIGAFSGTLKENSSFELASGLTLFAEYPLWRFGRQTELLGGIKYSFTQSARQLHLSGSWGGWDFAPEREELRPGEFAVQNTALYLKPRWLTGRITPQTVSFYTASNISYNFITLSGERAAPAKPDRAIGLGASLGAVFYDAVDAEFGIDMIYSNILNNGGRGTWSEFYTAYLAVGYRI